MVYVFDGLLHVTSEQMRFASSLVPSYRKEYAARYRFENDRIQSIFAFLLLQYAVREEYSIEDTLQLDYSNGKPRAMGFEDLHFNLSHCRLATACAVSDRPVGVDVQDWAQRHLTVAKQVCSAQELAYLKTAETPQVEFAKLWTRKESYGKYGGQGILYPMRELCLLGQAPCGTVMETFAFDGYALSYCAEETLEIRKVTMDDLLRGREKD